MPYVDDDDVDHDDALQYRPGDLERQKRVFERMFSPPGAEKNAFFRSSGLGRRDDGHALLCRVVRVSMRDGGRIEG